MNALAKSKAKERQAAIGRVLEILRRWGIESLGQFAALGKEAVAARLGEPADGKGFFGAKLSREVIYSV